MKCPFCGSELEPGAGFCPNCGTILSLDNEFVSPKQPAAPPQTPAAPDVTAPDIAAPEPASPAAPEALHGMPAYVSPTFEAYEPAQTYTVPEAGYDPEADDDDPFRELHPDLDEAPPAPPAAAEIPAESKISDTQPVALEGSIPVYEPTEESEQPAEPAAETDDLGDMYVTGGKSKKGRVVVLVAVLLLAAAAVGAWYYMKTENPFFRPSTEPSSSQTIDSTEPTADNTTQAPTEPTDESSTDADVTDESTSAADVTDESSTDADTTDESAATEPDSVTDLSADDNELTAPADTTAPTEAPTTTAAPPTTKAPTTTARPTTTAPRTTARPTTTARRTTTQAPTTQPTNTLQRPTATFAAKTMYINTNGVALRYAPRSGSANRVSLSVGADVRVTAEENGYCYVYSNRYGVSGWVKKSYLGASRPVAQTEQVVSGVVAPDVTVDGGTKTVNTGGSSLNLRKGPGTQYDIIRAVGDGYPVAVKGRSSTASGWVYVTDITRGVSGWVSSAYLH